jgi:hypothetical protein
MGREGKFGDFKVLLITFFIYMGRLAWIYLFLIYNNKRASTQRSRSRYYNISMLPPPSARRKHTLFFAGTSKSAIKGEGEGHYKEGVLIIIFKFLYYLIILIHLFFFFIYNY